MQAYTYILASKPRGTLYTGVTSDLVRRMWEHKTGTFGGFTAKYGVKTLVYFESSNDIREAIIREKQIKNRPRMWRIELIEAQNQTWRDLSEDF